MAMETYPIPSHAKGDFGQTVPNSRPRPPQPRSVAHGLHAAAEPCRAQNGGRAPHAASAAPELLLARPCPLGPALLGRLRCPPRSPQALRSPGPGPALPSPWRRSCSCGRPPAPRPDRKRKDSSPSRHYVNVPPPTDRGFRRAGRSTPDTSPSSVPSSSSGPSPHPRLFCPAASIPSPLGASVPLSSPPKQGTLFWRRDPA